MPAAAMRARRPRRIASSTDGASPTRRVSTEKRTKTSWKAGPKVSPSARRYSADTSPSSSTRPMDTPR